jgi:hypothetical protein
MYRSLPLLLILLWLVGGCVGVTAGGVPPGDDDSSAGDDDDIGDDDDDSSAGDDDDTTGDDDAVDDNTCDEGASSEQQVRFIFHDEVGSPVEGATWRVYDLDAETGAVDGTVIDEGTTSGKGHALTTLDCAYGWMLMEFSAETFATSHVFFRVNDQPAVPNSVITADYLDEQFGADIAAPEAGFLGVIKNSIGVGPDLQGEDSCTIDGSYELIPWDAADDIGILVYDGAFATQYFGLWYVDYELPGAGTVVEFRYEDLSAGQVFLAYLPVWSFADGDARHKTVVDIRS